MIVGIKSFCLWLYASLTITLLKYELVEKRAFKYVTQKWSFCIIKIKKIHVNYFINIENILSIIEKGRNEHFSRTFI